MSEQCNIAGGQLDLVLLNKASPLYDRTLFSNESLEEIAEDRYLAIRRTERVTMKIFLVFRDGKDVILDMLMVVDSYLTSTRHRLKTAPSTFPA